MKGNKNKDSWILHKVDLDWEQIGYEIERRAKDINFLRSRLYDIYQTVEGGVETTLFSILEKLDVAVASLEEAEGITP